MITLENINEQLMKQRDVQERTATDISKLKDAMINFIDFSKQSRLDDLEDKREAKKDPKAATVVKSNSSSKDGFGLAGLIPGLAGLAAFLGAAVALIAGFGAGLVASVKEWVKTVNAVFGGFLSRIVKAFRGLGRLIGLDIVFDDLAKAFRSFVDPVIDFFRTIRANFGTRIESLMKAVDAFFEPVGRFFKNFKIGFANVNTKTVGMFDDLLKMEDFTTFAAKLGAGVRGFANLLLGPLTSTDSIKDFKTVGTMISEMVDTVVKPIKTFFSAEGPIGRFMSSIKSVFGFAEEGSKVMKLLGAVGRIAGRLFYPFGIFMTIWDTISGAFKGFVDDEGNLGSKVLSAIEGGVSGFLKGLIGIPLDLLKEGVKWIATQLGFTDIAKAMDKFSFEEIIGGAVEGVYGLFRSIIDGAIELVAKAAGTLSDGAAEKIRSLKLGKGASASPIQMAEKSGLYDRSSTFFTDSKIDREKAKAAPIDQLKAILADDDLSPKDSKFVKDILEKRAPTTGATIQQGAKAATASAPVVVSDSRDQSDRSVTSVSSQAIAMQSGPPVDFSDPMLISP